MQQLTLPIDFTTLFYIPTPLDLDELGFRRVAPSRWGKPDQSIYWHGPGLAYEPVWTTGDWTKHIFPENKEALKRFFTPIA